MSGVRYKPDGDFVDYESDRLACAKSGLEGWFHLTVFRKHRRAAPQPTVEYIADAFARVLDGTDANTALGMPKRGKGRPAKVQPQWGSRDILLVETMIYLLELEKVGMTKARQLTAEQFPGIGERTIERVFYKHRERVKNLLIFGGWTPRLRSHQEVFAKK